jgi:hypothetical protein
VPRRSREPEEKTRDFDSMELADGFEPTTC